MMLENTVMRFGGYEEGMTCCWTSVISWRLGQYTVAAYPELVMQCYGYLQVKHMLEHICQVRAKEAAC